MAFVNILAARYAVGAPVSTDLFADVVGDLNFLNGVNTSAVDANGVPLVLNGSFEADANGTAAASMSNWSFAAGTGGTGTVVNADQNHGANSFKVTQDSTIGHSGGVLTSGAFFNTSGGFNGGLQIAGLAYTLIFMIKSSRTDVRIKAAVIWYAADQSVISTTTVYDGGAVPTAPTSWNTIGLAVTPPFLAMFGKLVFTLGDASVTPGATASIYLDGISFQPRVPFGSIQGFTSNSTFNVPSSVYKVNVRIFAAQGGGLGGGYREGHFITRPGDTISLTFGGTNTATYQGQTLSANIGPGGSTGGSGSADFGGIGIVHGSMAATSQIVLTF